ncbi:RHS repeat domain-containing protein, partial [Nocardia cyriacigeorgica]
PHRITRPDGLSIDIAYQSHNRPVSITGVDGTVTRQEWDPDGNLAAIIDPAGNRTTYTHHTTGAVATVTEPTGALTHIEVDAAGLPVRVTDPHGGLTTIERDHFGRPITVTDPLGSVVRYVWSGEGKLMRRIDPDGVGESWIWDGELNLTAHVNRANGITRYTYGAFDLLTARTEPDGAMTHYQWDTQRRLTAVANPIGQTWHYRYDPAGRLVSETDYTGATTHYTHDVAGRVATVTPATGVTRHHTHDVLGRLTSITADTGEWIHYTHDSSGRIKTAVSGVNDTRIHTLQFTHTPTGQLASQRLDDQPPMLFTHDEHGRRTTRTTPTGGVTTWTHDPTGRITQMTTDGHTINFTHDPLGRTTGWRIGKISIDRAYTAVGHTTHQVVTALAPGSTSNPGAENWNAQSREFDNAAPASRILRRDDYTWRPDGHLTTHTTTTDTAHEHRRYTLDPIGRVTRITRNGTPTEQYTYDHLSNITSGGVVTPDLTIPGAAGHPAVHNYHDAGQELPTQSDQRPNPTAPQQISPTYSRREYNNNLLIRDGRHQYHYDPVGRLIRKTTTRLSRKPDVWHYRYNAFDQLTDVYTPDGEWWQYTYDAFGRRTSKRHLAADQRIRERTDYVWDSAHLIEQSVGVNQAIETTTRWEYQPRTYVPLTQTIAQPYTDASTSTMVTDLVGTPICLIDPVIGHVESQAETDLLGRTTWSGSVDTPLRRPGQIHDAESGLHYNLARTYDPQTGRYLSRDPLGLRPAANPHTYPPNPLTWSDPLGLVPEECMVTVYRGTNSGAEQNVQDMTGYMMSDAARTEFMGTGSLESAMKASQDAHRNALDTWGSLDNYVQAHGEFGTELSREFGPRSMMSFTTDISVARQFGDAVYMAQVPRSMLTPQTIPGAGEAEVLIAHMVRVTRVE